jgi:hypothetical protein
MGRKQFEQIVASAPRERVVYNNLSQYTDLAAGSTQIIDIFAPDGTICELRLFHCNTQLAPGATSGDHYVSLTTNQAFGGFLYGSSNYNANLVFQTQDWWVADLISRPAQNRVESIRSLIFDSTVALRIIYKNNTNAAHTNDRYFAIMYVERTIG